MHIQSAIPQVASPIPNPNTQQLLFMVLGRCLYSIQDGCNQSRQLIDGSGFTNAS